MKKSFSLIELIVVMTIFVVLLFVVSNFLISVLQQNNEISISNEVRNEANRLMDQVTTDLRSSKCETVASDVDGNSIVSLFNVSDCTSVGAVPFAIYRVDSSSDLNLTKNNSILNSNTVKIRNCSVCSCATPLPGFVVTETAVGSRVYNVSVSLTQARDNPRADFCGKITTQKTVSPRNRN